MRPGIARRGLLLLLPICLLAPSCAWRGPPASPMPDRPAAAQSKRRLPPPPIPAMREVRIVEPCLSAADFQKLRAARPKPLRDQKMPTTAAERVARTAAQLGRYEARGQWADQVEKLLKDCEAKIQK